MKIGDLVSTAGMYCVAPNQKSTGPGSDGTFIQSIALGANTPIDSGAFAGKHLEMPILDGGGYEWSGAMRIKESEQQQHSYE